VLEAFADLFDDFADERPPPAAPLEEPRPLDTDIYTSSVQLAPATNAGMQVLSNTGYPILRPMRTFTTNIRRQTLGDDEMTRIGEFSSCKVWNRGWGRRRLTTG
jgi:hypothetical protein